MRVFFIGLVLSSGIFLSSAGQSNYALQIKKDTVKVNSTNLSVENNLVIKHLKNNPSGDSLLTTDANGNLKLVKMATATQGTKFTSYTGMLVDNDMNPAALDSIKFEITDRNGVKSAHGIKPEEFYRFDDFVAAPATFSMSAVNKAKGKMMFVEFTDDSYASNSKPWVLYGDTLTFKVDSLNSAATVTISYQDSTSLIGGEPNLQPIRLKIRNETRHCVFGVQMAYVNVLPGNGYDNKWYYAAYTMGVSNLYYLLSYYYFYKNGGGYGAYSETVKNDVQLTIKKNGAVLREVTIAKGQTVSAIPNDGLDNSWQTLELILRDL